MPQMAPLMWTALSHTITTVFWIVWTLMYFVKLPQKVQPFTPKLFLNKLTWKW